jgi:KUP system potassium uptake protein
MVACIGLVIGFGSSGNLAAAYGLAVTGTMAATTALFYFAARQRLGWTAARAGVVVACFLAVDLAFFAANAMKIREGGWFPLVLGGLLFTVMTTWMRGRRLLAMRLREDALSVDDLLARIRADEVHRVPGTAVFLSGRTEGVPPALLQNLAHNRVVHARVVMLTLQTEEQPTVPEAERATVRALGEGFHRVVVRYGFMEEPDVPATLARIRHPGLSFPAEETSYFLGGESLIPTERPGMALWREHLFSFLSRLARPATAYFRLPAGQVIEMRADVEL